jgi:two-component system alkaline phosphatase synthesis response regulator PhoP
MEAKRKTVLVVEDDDDVRQILSQVLRKHGASVVEASDGLQGVEAASAGDLDLIFMDLSMPNLNGIEAARRIRLNEKLRHIPIIFLTAHGDYGIKLFEDLSGIDTGGAMEYMAKPVELSDLEHVLRQYTGL